MFSHFFVESGKRLSLVTLLSRFSPRLASPVRFVFLLLHLPQTAATEKRGGYARDHETKK